MIILLPLGVFAGDNTCGILFYNNSEKGVIVNIYDVINGGRQASDSTVFGAGEKRIFTKLPASIYEVEVLHEVCNDGCDEVVTTDMLIIDDEAIEDCRQSGEGEGDIFSIEFTEGE